MHFFVTFQKLRGVSGRGLDASDPTEYFVFEGQYTIQDCESMAELIQAPFLIHTNATDKKPASCKCGESKYTCAGMAGPLTPKIQDCPQCSSSVPLQGDGHGVGTFIGVLVGILAICIIIGIIIAFSIYWCICRCT